MYRTHSITVVIPCLNEEEGIGKVLSRVPDYVDEVVVVDNGSTDATAEVAASHGATVIKEAVRGYGRAYKRGLNEARGDIIITLDGDHSYPVEDISDLIDALVSTDVRFLSASRFPIGTPGAMAPLNWVGNKVLSAFMSVLYLRRIRDSQSGMWIFYKDALNHMELVSDGMAFSEEIKIEAIRNRDVGFKEIPISYSNRAGEAKLRPWRDGWANLRFLFQKRLSQYKPRSQRTHVL